MFENQIQKSIDKFLKEQEKDFNTFSKYIKDFTDSINKKEK
jgi:hypothetical protein